MHSRDDLAELREIVRTAIHGHGDNVALYAGPMECAVRGFLWSVRRLVENARNPWVVYSVSKLWAMHMTGLDMFPPGSYEVVMSGVVRILDIDDAYGHAERPEDYEAGNGGQ